MRTIYFPLASNAHGLLAGAGVSKVRDRLKLASILYDSVLIESGMLRLTGGPRGSSQWRTPDTAARWQHPRERGNAQGGEFNLSIAPTAVEGAVQIEPSEVFRSSIEIDWRATFEPFRRELPAAADWITYGVFPPLSDAGKQEQKQWVRGDQSNPRAVKVFPSSFVRDRVLENVATDLTTAAHASVTASVDSLHGKLVSLRLARREGFAPAGFSMPIVFPYAQELPWETILEIRKHPAIGDLRKLLFDIEGTALQAANAGGSVRDAVANSYASATVSVSARLDSVWRAIGVGAAELVVGGAIGFATAGLDWVGLLAGAAPGVAMTTADSIQLARGNRRKRWLAVAQAIHARPK